MKVGDKVRRIKDEWYGMQVGDEDTITEMLEMSVRLRNFGGTHAKSNLEVVEEFKPAALMGAGLTSEPMILPSDPAVRKNLPITTGVLDYFPLALAEVAKVSKAGNDQHNPGQPLHWDKTKSLDHADTIPRHLIDRGRLDTDGMRHSAKLAWRALALLQTELEQEAANG